MKEFGDLERDYIKEEAYIQAMRANIEWQMYIEELEKDQKPAKITVNNKEVDYDKLKSREISRNN